MDIEEMTDKINEHTAKSEDNIKKIKAIIRKANKTIKRIEDENWRF